MRPDETSVVVPASSLEVSDAIQRSVLPAPGDEQLNDDERERFDWSSRYPQQARRQIHLEAWFVALVILFALLALFITWHGFVPSLLTYQCVGCNVMTLQRYGYVFFAGVLGGGLFGLKYLYKVVARGWWNQDRVIWRYASPLLSGGLAFAAGTLAHAGIFGFASSQQDGAVSYVALGFIVGYFADSASRKMQEVAETMFGGPGSSVGQNPKS